MHCWPRLYSSAVFNNDMKDFAVPEIQQKPADGLLLQMKAMNIDKEWKLFSWSLIKLFFILIFSTLDPDHQIWTKILSH